MNGVFSNVKYTYIHTIYFKNVKWILIVKVKPNYDVTSNLKFKYGSN